MPNMNAPLFMLNENDLQLEVNSYKPGLGLAWGQLFPLKFTPKFDLKGLEGDEGIPVTADRVAFNASAPLKTRTKIGVWSGQLHKIAISRVKDEVAINEYNTLRALAAVYPNDSATAQYLVDMVYNDTKYCADGMDYRVELDAMRIGSSGKGVLSTKLDGDKATADEINFNIPDKHFVGSAVAWSDSENADGLGDIISAQKVIIKQGLAKPMYAIMNQTAFDYLSKQKSVARRIAPMLLRATNLDTLTQADLASINTYMKSRNWPQILIIDPYVTVEHLDGTKEGGIQPWNPNVVTLSPTPQLGWTYYKPVPIIQNTAAIQTQGSYYKITVYSDVNPMVETTIAEAYIQPGLINRASLMFLNTNSTTWNSGN